MLIQPALDDPPAMPLNDSRLLPTEAPEISSGVPLAEPPPMFDWISRSLCVTCTNSIPAAADDEVPSLPADMKAKKRSREEPTWLTLHPAAVVDCVASYCWQIT
jgi:hypothetical protein